jgi:hypothetical protein
MLKSKKLSELIKTVMESTDVVNHHLEIAHTAAMKALSGGTVIIDPRPEGSVNMSVKNFTFDPYGTRCTWVQDFNGRECSVELFSMEYQPPQAVENSIRIYQPGQGIHLRLTFGRSSIGTPGSFKQQGGSKVLSVNSKRFVHKGTYRGLDTVFYKVLSDLVSAARLQGLEGINFPQDWDEIPYD